MKYTTYYTITLVENNIIVSTFTRFSETEWSGWSNEFDKKSIKFKNMYNNNFIVVSKDNDELVVDTTYNVRMIDNYYVVEASGSHTTIY